MWPAGRPERLERLFSGTEGQGRSRAQTPVDVGDVPGVRGNRRG